MMEQYRKKKSLTNVLNPVYEWRRWISVLNFPTCDRIVNKKACIALQLLGSFWILCKAGCGRKFPATVEPHTPRAIPDTTRHLQRADSWYEKLTWTYMMPGWVSPRRMCQLCRWRRGQPGGFRKVPVAPPLTLSPSPGTRWDQQVVCLLHC